jgi:hypothetical protein
MQRRLRAILGGLSCQEAAGDVEVLEDELVEIMLPPRHSSRHPSIQVRRATVADIPSLRAVTHCELPLYTFLQERSFVHNGAF